MKSYRNFFTVSFMMLLLTLTGCNQTDEVSSKDLSQYRGKWLVINYWATWCAPCIEEIPELNQLAATHPDKLAVLGVDFDQAEGEARAQNISKMGIEFTVLTDDPATTLGIAAPSALPTTLILNPEGQLVHTLFGPQTESGLLALIDSL